MDTLLGSVALAAVVGLPGRHCWGTP